MTLMLIKVRSDVLTNCHFVEYDRSIKHTEYRKILTEINYSENSSRTKISFETYFEVNINNFYFTLEVCYYQ